MMVSALPMDSDPRRAGAHHNSFIGPKGPSLLLFFISLSASPLCQMEKNGGPGGRLLWQPPNFGRALAFPAIVPYNAPRTRDF